VRRSLDYAKSLEVSAPCKFNFVVKHQHRAVKLWDPVGWAFDNLDDVLEEARRSAEVTHKSSRRDPGGAGCGNRGISCSIEGDKPSIRA